MAQQMLENPEYRRKCVGPVKPKLHPVKIYENSDACKLGEKGHLFATVKHRQGCRAYVDVRHYRPDDERPGFYHPNATVFFMSREQFVSMMQQAKRIISLLDQFEGVHTATTGDATKPETSVMKRDYSVAFADVSPEQQEKEKPVLQRQNGEDESADNVNADAFEEFLRNFSAGVSQ